VPIGRFNSYRNNVDTVSLSEVRVCLDSRYISTVLNDVGSEVADNLKMI